jgi:hypothetical protein
MAGRFALMSSGVRAGTDTALCDFARLYGAERAGLLGLGPDYEWKRPDQPSVCDPLHRAGAPMT